MLLNLRFLEGPRTRGRSDITIAEPRQAFLFFWKNHCAKNNFFPGTKLGGDHLLEVSHSEHFKLIGQAHFLILDANQWGLTTENDGSHRILHYFGESEELQ